MRILVALVALLALSGIAMAWNLNEVLEYTYTKSAYQEAGDDLVMPQIVKAESHANFLNPSYYNGTAFGALENELGNVTLDREIFNPPQNMTQADFYATLTQGGKATLATHSPDAVSNTIPEIVGTATAYQNLAVMGGFDEAEADFESSAMVGIANATGTVAGPANHWVVTETVTPTTASVDAEKFGAGDFITANLGEQVKADIEQQWRGSGWDDPTYSGGITMWAEFTGAHDPFCANPIISTVNGSAATAIFPANQAKMPAGLDIGDRYFWGDNLYTPQGEDGAPVNPEIQDGSDGTPNHLTTDTGADGMFGINEGHPDDVLFDP